MDFTIRAARPEDYAALGELTALAYLDDGLLDYGADDPYLEVLRDVGHRAEHAEVLVAVDPAVDPAVEVAADPARDPAHAPAGRVVGGVAFVGEPGRFSDIAVPGEAEFRTLAVASHGRGRGVGAALVQECIDRARALGRRRLVLSTHPRMHAAHRLYERFGFVRDPERDWNPIGDLRLLVYVLDLSPDDGA